MTQPQLEMILEAALFAAAEPLSLSQLEQMIDKDDRPDRDVIVTTLDALVEHYAHRGVNLIKVASGYHFVTHPETAQTMQRLLERKPPRYSRALLETLALVIYRQPITRGEIEQVRGVAVSTKIIQTLMEREWISVVGHKAVPGQPALYATTKQLLDYFNVQNLNQLPALADLVDLDDVGDKLSKQLALEIPEQAESDISDQLLQPEVVSNTQDDGVTDEMLEASAEPMLLLDHDAHDSDTDMDMTQVARIDHEEELPLT